MKRIRRKWANFPLNPNALLLKLIVQVLIWNNINMLESILYRKAMEAIPTKSTKNIRIAFGSGNRVVRTRACYLIFKRELPTIFACCLARTMFFLQIYRASAADIILPLFHHKCSLSISCNNRTLARSSTDSRFDLSHALDHVKNL